MMLPPDRRKTSSRWRKSRCFFKSSRLGGVIGGGGGWLGGCSGFSEVGMRERRLWAGSRCPPPVTVTEDGPVAVIVVPSDVLLLFPLVLFVLLLLLLRWC